MADIVSAIRAHEEGDFFASAQLWDILTRIGRVEGCVNTRVSALIAKGGAANFRIEPPKAFAKDRAAVKLAADVEGWWWSVWPDWVWRSILSSRIGMGIAYGTREWYSKDGRWFFHLNPWPLQHLRWDGQACRYMVTCKEGVIPIEPDDPTWWVFEPSGPRSWMRGAVRSIGDLGSRRDEILLRWSTYCRRHGTPIVAIEEPEDADGPQADAFYKKMQGTIAGGTVRLPQRNTVNGKFGYDVRIVEPKTADGWKAFEAFWNVISTEIAVRIKGQNLTTEVQGGSFAATKQHGGTDHLILASDSQELSTLGHREVHVWCVANVPRHNPGRTPWPVYDVSEAEDGKMLGEAMQAVGDGVAKLLAVGINPDRADMCGRARISLDPKRPLFDIPDPQEQGGADGEGGSGDGGGGDGKGQDPAPQDAPDDEDDDSGGKSGAEQTSARAPRPARARARGTTGGGAPVPPGAAEGQAALDQRLPELAAAVGAAMAPDMGDIMAAVNAGQSAQEIFTNILRTFEGQAPDVIAEALTQALIFAELAGRYSALVDQVHEAGDGAREDPFATETPAPAPN